MLDLNSLDDTVNSGEPLQLDIKKVHEDPNQPRTIFDEVSLYDLSDNIAARGVKSPISVRPHPTLDGEFIINHGARRYRASLLANKNTIPAFIDNDYNDYDQVAENKDRENLKPMEMAIFINRKIKEGAKKSAVAKKLNLDASSITHYLSMIDLPDCLESLYRTDKTTSPKTLYELRNVYDSNPSFVEKWASTVEEVSRRDITMLKTQLATESIDNKVEEETNIESPILDEENQNAAPVETETKTKPNKKGKENDLGHDQEINHNDFHNEKPIKEDKPVTSKLVKSIEIASPSIVVNYDNKEAVLILSHKPKSKDKVFIKYLSPKHGIDFVEVNPKDLQIKSLIDTKA